MEIPGSRSLLHNSCVPSSFGKKAAIAGKYLLMGLLFNVGRMAV